MNRIFSGVQPTGHLHLGNYLGAIREFTRLQYTNECFFCVVDMHAITVKQEPEDLNMHTLEIAASYLACGIDPMKATIFVQSHVPAHAEMAWLLNCVARMGWLERMVQFKDKAGKDKERASVGLFTYPILMAADILTYKATHVPVGDDQKQHLNLTRDIAEKFNHEYMAGYFPVPEAMHGNNSRVMSLQDAAKKMSKSDEDDKSRINLNDSNDEIIKKIRKATATTEPFPTSEEGILTPEIENLIGIYQGVSDLSREDIFAKFGGQGYGVFKPALADALIAVVEPIRTRFEEYVENPDGVSYLREVITVGAERANAIAAQTVLEVRDLMGFTPK
jgi:tryptophanyl-tRNA synthetase